MSPPFTRTFPGLRSIGVAIITPIPNSARINVQNNLGETAIYMAAANKHKGSGAVAAALLEGKPKAVSFPFCAGCDASPVQSCLPPRALHSPVSSLSLILTHTLIFIHARAHTHTRTHRYILTHPYH